MDAAHVALVLGAGWVAGCVNTIAGAGSLLTFPVLLASGLPPLVANTSNCLGVVPGSLAGAYGLRQDLAGARVLLRGLVGWAAAGSVVGAVLLLALPSGAFDQVVPVLVALAGVLVLLGPVVQRRAAGAQRRASALTGPVVGAIAVYGGYFGAALGVLLVGSLGLLSGATLRALNARKNVLAALCNGTAGLVYAVHGPINWTAAGLLGAGSALGGPVGARLARRVRPGPLRALLAAVSLGVAAHLGLSAYR